MEVSVVIPVYNAAPFIRRTVESALIQPETGEVIIVEDASSDDSLRICQELADKHSKVKLYRHPDLGNHGVSVSSNLGIENSRCEYVAILGADDFFLPGRFKNAKRIFDENPEVEGVYEATGMYFENENAEKRWKTFFGGSHLNKMSRRIPHLWLFEALLTGKYGSFSIISLVVKRKVFRKTGFFDKRLTYHQDTDMLIKLAALCRLEPGRLSEPVAMYRIHDSNRWAAERPLPEIYKSKFLLYMALWQWSRKNLDMKRQQILLNRFLNSITFSPLFKRSQEDRFRKYFKRIQLGLAIFRCPALAREALYWKYLLGNLVNFLKVVQ